MAPKQAAIISDCGTYRYALSRPREGESAWYPAAVFLMLNPSTADADNDDPTIRRCRRFAKDWSCEGLIVGNLFALRSTDPDQLLTHADPIGPDNDSWLRRMTARSVTVVCAWGAHPMAVERGVQVARMLTDVGVSLFCLGTTKSGAPRHPLYVRADQKLIKWEIPNG